MDFETYRYVFCVLVGALFGVVYLLHRIMSGCVGLFGSFADRDEYGDVKIFSGWNLGFASVTMILVFMFFSADEGSFVDILLRDSWEYLLSQGVLG